jgi:hypothetical protein
MLPLPGPPPLLQNAVGLFDGGSMANVAHYKMHPVN